MNLKAKENILMGQIVNSDKNFCCFIAGVDGSIGVAARDIKKGEILKYDFTKNTNDILIKMEFSR